MENKKCEICECRYTFLKYTQTEARQYICFTCEKISEKVLEMFVKLGRTESKLTRFQQLLKMTTYIVKKRNQEIIDLLNDESI